jgi:hypothetical protein
MAGLRRGKDIYPNLYEVLFTLLCSRKEAQTAGEEFSAIEVHPDTERKSVSPAERKALSTATQVSEEEALPKTDVASNPVAEKTKASVGLPIRVHEHKFFDGRPKSLLELYKEHRRLLLYEYHYIQYEIDKLQGKGKAKTSRSTPKEPS